MLAVMKETRINVRTSPQIKRELEIAARLKGITPSALVNWAVVRAIREEKERDPHAFTTNNISRVPPRSEKTMPMSKSPITNTNLSRTRRAK